MKYKMGNYKGDGMSIKPKVGDKRVALDGVGRILEVDE